MKNSRDLSTQSGFTPIIIAVVVVILIAAGAYYFGTLNTKPNLVSNIATSTPSSTVKPNMDPTANWKIFANTKYNFSVKYPSEFFLHEDIAFSTLAINTKDFVIPVFDNGTYGELPFFMNILPKTGDISLENPKFTDPIKNSFTQDTLQITTIKVGDHNATMYSGDLSQYLGGQKGDKHYTVLLEDSDNIYLIHYQTFVADNFTPEIFNQILSTFKFTK